jgi:hypothetical protein
VVPAQDADARARLVDVDLFVRWGDVCFELALVRLAEVDFGGLEAESLGSISLLTPSQDSSDWLDTSLLPAGETWTPVPELPSSVNELEREPERELVLWCVSIWRARC